MCTCIKTLGYVRGSVNRYIVLSTCGVFFSKIYTLINSDMDTKSALNLFALSVSTFCKWPQILYAYRSRSTAGLSLTSLAFEMASLSITLAYYAAYGYPIWDYLDYHALILQNWIYLALVAYFKGVSPSKALAVFATYALAISALSTPAIVPFFVVDFLTSMTILTASISRFAQIRAIYVSKRGEDISRIPFLVFFMTSCVRIYTVYAEKPDDWLLIFKFVWSGLCNLAVIATAEIYTTSATKRIQ